MTCCRLVIKYKFLIGMCINQHTFEYFWGQYQSGDCPQRWECKLKKSLRKSVLQIHTHTHIQRVRTHTLQVGTQCPHSTHKTVCVCVCVCVRTVMRQYVSTRRLLQRLSRSMAVTTTSYREYTATRTSPLFTLSWIICWSQARLSAELLNRY